MPLAAIPHHQPTGSRFVPGVGSMPDAVYLSVQLDGVPKWVVGTPSRSRASWLVALEDGRVLSVDAHGRLNPAGQLAPGQPPVGMIDPDGDLALLPMPADVSVRSVPVVLPDGLLYVAGSGDVVRTARGTIMREAWDALPDARIVVRENYAAVYAGQTSRYTHGVLGDTVEATALIVFDTETLAEMYRIVLDDGLVFEGLTPLWADIDGNGVEELIATVADEEVGARIRVYAGDTGSQIAEGPLIGRGGRWRHQLVAGAFSEDGVIELASVLTPHIGGMVQFNRLSGGEFPVVAELRGFTSHVLYSDNLDMAVAGDFDGDGRVELVLPDQERRNLAGLRRDGPEDIEVAWIVPVDGMVSTNLAALTLADGHLALAVGTDSGLLHIWLPTE
ncbi:MAG: hypothetical protein IT298_07615 [Chloroflexi bacterium]|jgi:hypothetical protein|nr:hypothetical protein [Chloroflexota bacterium]OQY82702.1 MAG: hypothetical protein B6D42_08950 [Anaerolineae bacterium UTCFX5]